jgi:iron complex outermembrane receptor protein
VVLFDSRHRNHLHLEATGRQRELAPGSAVPELAWRQAPARVRGLEAQGRVRLRERRSGVLDLELRGALLHGTQEANGQPLPGLAPVQVGAALAGEHGAWGGRVDVDHAARQRRVPPGQPAGASNTLWGAALSYRSKAGAADMLWYARVENLGNRKASSPASLLAQGESGRNALQGRTLRVGVNASF